MMGPNEAPPCQTGLSSSWTAQRKQFTAASARTHPRCSGDDNGLDLAVGGGWERMPTCGPENSRGFLGNG